MTISKTTERVRKSWESLKTLSSPHPRILLGLSLGGMVALDWMARYPEDFDALILLNTSTASVALPWQRMTLKALPHVIRAVISRDSVQRERAILSFTTTLSAERKKEISKIWAGYAKDSPMTHSNFFRQLIAAARFRPKTLPQCPTLVISSLEDQLVRPSCSERLSQLLNATLVTHPWGGHDITLEDPQWVCEQIATWLEHSHLHPGKAK